MKTKTAEQKQRTAEWLACKAYLMAAGTNGRGPFGFGLFIAPGENKVMAISPEQWSELVAAIGVENIDDDYLLLTRQDVFYLVHYPDLIRDVEVCGGWRGPTESFILQRMKQLEDEDKGDGD